MMRIVLILSAVILLSACASNHVETIQQDTSVVKYSKKYPEGDRFGNLYPGKKTYPLTCQKDCYPKSSYVICESEAEQCQFKKRQTPPKLNAGFKIRWLGHASFYIESPDGSSLLIDPVSEQFDWPVDWAFRLSAGFFRNKAKWPTSEETSNIDAVLYSHIHYDHFNKSDITRLGNTPEYFVPLGFSEHFANNGYHINEMSWYSAKRIGKLNIKFVPAHHFSSRIWVPYLYEDDDKTLWGGWVIEHQGKKIFFAGDTGYSKHFADIQQRYGDMDICLMPIASYFHKEHSDWYRYVHTTPEDSINAAKDLNCKVMIPWGYGNASWKMGDHSSHSALLRLLHMHKEMGSPIPLHILNEGEEVSL